MTARPKVATPALDRVIADSKRITEDLMLLRHAVRECWTEERIRLAKDRLYLVIGNVHLLAEELHALWEESHEALRHKSRTIVSPELGNGRPMLVNGGDR